MFGLVVTWRDSRGPVRCRTTGPWTQGLFSIERILSVEVKAERACLEEERPPGWRSWLARRTDKQVCQGSNLAWAEN